MCALLWHENLDSLCLHLPFGFRYSSDIEYSPTKAIDPFCRKADVDIRAVAELPGVTKPRTITPDVVRQFSTERAVRVGVDIDDLVDRVLEHIPLGGDCERLA